MRHLDDCGMPVGWALITLGTIGSWMADHGLELLSGISIVVGVACQVWTTYLRHRDYRERWERWAREVGE